MLTKERSRALTRLVLSSASLDDVVVSLTTQRTGNTRFANNQPTTNADVTSGSLSITATTEGRSATVTTNQFDELSWKSALAEAEALARLAPIDPEYVAPLGAQKYVKVNARDPKTSKLNAPDRLAIVAVLMDEAKRRGLLSSGFVQHDLSGHALANRAGLFSWHSETEISVSTTARTANGRGSGRAGSVSHRIDSIDPKKLAVIASEVAERSREPEPLEPGKKTVLLEAQAVGDLLSFLLSGFDVRSADEGRSFFSRTGGGTKIGELLFSKDVSLRSDPSDPNDPSSPVGSGGMPRGLTQWVTAGRLEALSRSRYWAAKAGGTPLASPGSLFMSGSERSVDDLMTQVESGVLIRRFWYNRMLEPRTLLATGLTRDGTFEIKGGKIVRPVNNFRYNESPVTLLTRVVAMGKPERVEAGRMVLVVPPLVVTDFNLASASDAV